jgi:hypothetical protein
MTNVLIITDLCGALSRGYLIHTNLNSSKLVAGAQQSNNTIHALILPLGSSASHFLELNPGYDTGDITVTAGSSSRSQQVQVELLVNTTQIQ